jgi:hypothetical protein
MFEIFPLLLRFLSDDCSPLLISQCVVVNGPLQNAVPRKCNRWHSYKDINSTLPTTTTQRGRRSHRPSPAWTLKAFLRLSLGSNTVQAYQNHLIDAHG